METDKKERPAYIYAQHCATALMNFGLMTKTENKKFLVKVEKWLKKYGIEPETTHF